MLLQSSHVYISLVEHFYFILSDASQLAACVPFTFFFIRKAQTGRE